MRRFGNGFALGRWGVLALAFGIAASCSKGQSSAMAQPTVAPPRPAPTVAAVPPPAEGEHGAGRKGGGGFNESTVYVDGKARGILRYSELPPSLQPFALPEIDDKTIPRYYRLADYLELIGVDLHKVRELQIYGSHDRIAVLSAEDVLTHRDSLVFDFTQQTQGKPRARWAQTHALSHRPMVDIIMNISVYVEKTPPTFAHGDMWIDGRVVDEAIPYVGDGVPKGTRVYVDGHLEGWVRRKKLPNKLIAPGSEPTHARFSTDAFISYLGASTHGAKAIDFFEGDDMLARVDGKTWSQSKGEYAFELPNRSHGQVKELFPGDKSSRVTSIQLYVRTTPPDRQPDPAALEQHGGSDDTQNAGGGSGNGDGNGGNSGVTPVAQPMNKGSSPADDDQY